VQGPASPFPGPSAPEKLTPCFHSWRREESRRDRIDPVGSGQLAPPKAGRQATICLLAWLPMLNFSEASSFF